MPARYDALAMRAVFEAYVPRLKDGTPDPNVLYVGPFIDGLIDYVPEFLSIAFPNSPVETRRTNMKVLLAGIGASVDRATHYVVRELQVNMTRRGWADKGGRAPTVMLNDRIREEEPGELLNSYVVERSPETGELRLMARKKGSEDEMVPYVPKIREDKRYGLHYLMKGDEFEFVFKTRRSQLVTLRYSLKPLSEGSSLITPEAQVDARRW